MRGFIQFPALTGQKKDLGLTARHQVNSDSEDEIFSLLPQQRQKKYNAKKLKSRGCDSSSPECKGAVTMLLIILWVSTVALIVLTAFGEFNIENDNGTSSEKPAERLKHDNMVLEYFDSYMNQALKIARSNNNSISNNNNAIGYRLPRNVIPINYYLKISPNLEQFKYSGYVLITTKIESNTNFVVLHSKNHVIDKAMLVRHDRTIEHMNVTKDTKRDFLILASSRQLKKETPYHIKINFHGKIKGELTGFYSDSYINGKGKRK